MKKHHCSEPLLVAKAAGRFPEGSDFGVDAFGRAVADSVFKAENHARRLGVGHHEHVNRKTLEQQGKARMRLGPRHPHLPDSMPGAINPQCPSVKKGLKLANNRHLFLSHFGIMS